MDFDNNTGCLQFDHLSFKLAILQDLIFKSRFFQFDYEMEEFIQQQGSYDEWQMDMYHKILDLKIPSYLAEYVTDIKVTPEDEIYQVVCPGWKKDGFFHIEELSDRELSQFRSLKHISIQGMSGNGNALERQLRLKGIKAEFTNQKGKREKKLGGDGNMNPVLSILILLLVCCSVGGAALSYVRQYLVTGLEIVREEEDADYQH